MSTLTLGNLVVRLGFHRMNEVRELDSILDKEDWDVVADEIPVALLRIELGREASNIADSILGCNRSGR